MVDMDAVNKTLEKYMNNEHWEKVYESCPSDVAKLHLALDFHYGRTDDREVYDAMRKTEERFTIEDWEHYMTYCGNNPRYARAVNAIKALKAKQGI